MRNTPVARRLVAVLWLNTLFVPALLGATIPQIQSQIEPATGKAKDTTTAFTVTGLVSARATLGDGQVLAFLQRAGEAGIPILVASDDALKIIPRNEVTLTGTLGDGPLDFAVLKVKEGTVTVGHTNRPIGVAEPRGPVFFKEATSLAGRYVSLTNVTFVTPKLDESGGIRVQGDGGEVPLLVTQSLKDRELPAEPVNIFGVPLRIHGEWHLLAARFLSVNNRAAQAMATKHTCLSCHNPDVKAVGPAYRDVAARYKDDPEAVQKMCLQMERGGGGRWGAIPMPPLGAKVPAADRLQLAQWIHGYRWDALLAE
ncbi:MAG: hypothetical protein KIT22_09325 [Verrucomicrobiae bacterium]|nr:hypothetical protein [Verrucomicrobiae bacterium]